MNSSIEHRIPVLWETEVFIAGAGSGAVAAALAARRAGRRAMVAADLTYFGEECAGTLRVRPGRGSDDPLFQKLFSPTATTPPTPLFLKRALETELLEAGIPFLYGVRPVALLRTAAGTIRGAVLAARTSLYAVTFHMAVDATRQGLLARLAGARIVPAAPVAPSFEWTVIAAEAPRSEPPDAFTHTDTGITFARLPVPGGEVEARVFRLHFAPMPVQGGIAERAALEHRLKSRLLDGRVLYTADLPLLSALDRLEAPPKPRLEHLRDDDLVAAPGLYLLNGLLPLDENVRAVLDEPAAHIEMGTRVGRLAASADMDRGDRPKSLWLDAGGEARGCFQFAPSFVRPSEDRSWMELSFDTAPEIGRCDVVVAGGGTAGAPAGIAAARANARTVVLESLHGLGGVGTLGLIARYCHGNPVGFTKEMDEALARLAPLSTDPHSRTWPPELKDAWYQRALIEAGGSAWFGSFAFGVCQEDGRVAGLLVSTPFGSGLLRAGAVVDATGNADLAAAAGAPVRWVDARHLAVQGCGLSPRVLGQHYSNSDHTFVDDADPVSVTHAFANARAKFPDAFDVATLVGSRERRQIVGEIELSPLDFLAGRTFPDTVTIARSNFDTHGFTIHPVFLVVPPDKEPLWAHVPFRCLLPRGVEGLIVTGLGMSAHRDALPVVRMQPDVQNQGYAAGLAAAAAHHDGRTRALNLRALQRRLVEVGILPPETLAQEDSFPLPAQVVHASARQGPTDLYHAAVIFAHPEESAPVLEETIRSESDGERREVAALALGLMGRSEAAPALAAIVGSRPWDEGWNFRGMDQFGFSASRMDALMIALGRSAAAANAVVRAQAREAVREKIESLDATAAFSHCRAVGVAAGMLGGVELAKALALLLQRPGMSGHAQTDMAETVRQANRERNETRARNDALRELYLARGLYLCGDFENLGRRILETYTRDLRGPFARHAVAVLAEKDLDALRREIL